MNTKGATARPDHEVIYLQPACCADTDHERTGRQWCEDNVFECDDGAEATKYVRADLHSTLTEENARLSIRVKEMEERETPGASEAFTALDLADNLIERSYGTDVPVEWKRAIKKVVRARAALEQSK